MGWIFSYWKLYQAKKLLKQTEVGSFLLEAAGAVQYRSTSPSKILHLANQFGFVSPLAIFHYKNNLKTVFFRSDLPPSKLSIVLAHELTHASDYTFLNAAHSTAASAPSSDHSEEMAIAFQHEFVRQLLQRKPALRSQLR